MTNPQDDISVNVFDPDEQETSEWLEALHSVIESEGRDRAHYLMERLADVARQKGVNLPFSSNTAYINTIPPDLQQGSPGNMDYEARLRGWMRWNAMARSFAPTRMADNLAVISLIHLAGNHVRHWFPSFLACADRNPSTAISSIFRDTPLPAFMHVLFWKGGCPGNSWKISGVKFMETACLPIRIPD